MTYEKELQFAKDLALEAGGIMRRYFRAEDIGTIWKEDSTPLTVADTKINGLVIERVKAAFQEHGVLGEEESYELNRDMVWVVDPIDGTIPFSLDMPLSTFMLALVDRKDGQPVVAVIYEPFLDHLYSAVKGEGAFLNDMAISAAQDLKLTQTYISLYGPPVNDDKLDYSPGKLMEELRDKKVRNILISSGAYTAGKLAEGKFAAIVAAGLDTPWDFAASALIVQEAGGIVTDLLGKPRRFDGEAYGCIQAANKHIHSELLKLIRAR